MIATSHGMLFSPPDRRAGRRIVGIWLIANVLMQGKHEGDANDLSLRCLSTDLAVAMVARQRAHTHSHIHTQNTKSPEAEIRDKPAPKFEIKL